MASAHTSAKPQPRKTPASKSRLKPDAVSDFSAPTASHLFLKNMLDNIADPIFVKNQAHQWIGGNKAFWQLMGGPEEMFIGKSDYEFFPKEQADVFWYEDNKVFETGEPSINEEFFTDRQGVVHVISTKKTAFPNEHGDMVLVGIIRDVTAQKELEQLEEQRLKAAFYKQLEAQMHQLKQTNYELSRFAWVASHDLQEPLRTIVTHLELLARRNEGKLDERSAEYIQTAIESSHRLQKLVEDLLVHSTANKITDIKPVDLNDVLHHIMKDIKTTIVKTKARITSDQLPVVMGDQTLLTQVLQNLICNSIKFTIPDILPKIHVSGKSREVDWLCRIQDNGIGVDPAFRESIFGFFERLHSSAEYAGSGIGLASCKKIIELHGGQIWMEPNSNGQGSSFCFTIPKPPPAEV